MYQFEECYPRRKGRSIKYNPSERRMMKRYEKQGFLCSHGDNRYYWTDKGREQKKQTRLKPEEKRRISVMQKIEQLRSSWYDKEDDRRVLEALENI